MFFRPDSPSSFSFSLHIRCFKIPVVLCWTSPVCHDFYTGELWDRPECKVQVTKFINILSCYIVTALGLLNQLSYESLCCCLEMGELKSSCWFKVCWWVLLLLFVSLVWFFTFFGLFEFQRKQMYEPMENIQHGMPQHIRLSFMSQK